MARTWTGYVGPARLIRATGGAIRDHGGRRAGRRAPRARRGGLDRRRRRHLPALELAPVHADAAHARDDRALFIVDALGPGAAQRRNGLPAMTSKPAQRARITAVRTTDPADRPATLKGAAGHD